MSDNAFGGDANPVPGNPWSQIVEVHFVSPAPLILATLVGRNPQPTILDGTGTAITEDTPVDVGTIIDPAKYADLGYYDPFGNIGVTLVGSDLALNVYNYIIPLGPSPVPRITNEYVNRIQRSLIFNMKNITKGGIFVSTGDPGGVFDTTVSPPRDLVFGPVGLAHIILPVVEFFAVTSNVTLKAYPQDTKFTIAADSLITAGDAIPKWTATTPITPLGESLTAAFDKNGLLGISVTAAIGG